MGSLVDSYSGFAVDLDGVVWRGETLLDGARRGIDAIRRSGKPLLLLTNNAGYSPKFVSQRLESEGISVNPSEILSSGVVARDWIEQNGLGGVPSIVIGSPEIVEYFSDIVDLHDPNDATGVRLVLVARDPAFDFRKLTATSEAVRQGAEFVGVNRDTSLPVEGGFEPGTGAILSAIEVAGGRRATILGKPEAPMMEHAVRILGKSGVLMIGDRVDSDIAGAKRVGWNSALVLSGVTSTADGADPRPDHVIASLADIAN